jgi:gas vesicle protein
MMTASVHQCEQEVEAARAKLAADLATLRSPATFRTFSEDLKKDAIETKDALLAHAKDTAQEKFSGFIEDLKAKAAANPAATLTITAGLAWQFFRKPSITSVLIAAGLYSLLRTPSSRTFQHRDYFRESRQRLAEQVTDAAASVRDMAANVGGKVGESAATFAETASDKMTRWSNEARDLASSVAASTREQATQVTAKAGQRAEELASHARSAAASAAAEAATAVGRGMATARDQLPSGEDARDRMLLGLAGLAVAAAVGVAYQKRMSEDA